MVTSARAKKKKKKLSIVATVSKFENGSRHTTFASSPDRVTGLRQFPLRVYYNSVRWKNFVLCLFFLFLEIERGIYAHICVV